MRDIYPSFYHTFRCIANRCEDSCCKDWDIDVDSATEQFYQTVKGPLGDKIRNLLITDEYGERVFRSGDGRCPFWNRDMLCDIYIGIGEEHLSRTCAHFPRVHIDFGDFREHLLSFACPEAARFMLRADESAYADFGGSDRFIFDMHLQFEIMSDTWKAALTETAALADRLAIAEDFARDFEKFALYYTYRYYLEAVNSGDVLYAIKRIVCAYLVTGKMDAVFAQKSYPLSRMRILQRYSKEVEHSYDNTEKLNAEFDADSRFSVENLIAMLEGMA